MARRLAVPLTVLFLLPVFTVAKDKNKPRLPDFVLQARTVYVLIDPDAAMLLENPNANRTARDEVEKALMRWGRLELTVAPRTADLIISVQKGSGKLASPTIEDGPVDGRPVIVESTGDANEQSTRMGVQRGTPPGSNAPVGTPPSGGHHPGTQIGGADDKFEVYQGGAYSEDGISGAPVWRYTAKSALNAPDVPAVEQFRKAIDEAEKLAAKKKQP